MLKTNIICVGKPTERFFTDASSEYVKRLGAYCEVNIVEIAERRLSPSPSPADIRHALDEEGRAILQKLPRSGHVTALCVEGKLLSSEQLAENLRALQSGGYSCLTFIIGSSHGLSDEVKAAADLKLSLSSMCFAHSLARVMLLEQLYRGLNILSGGKYHK